MDEELLNSNSEKSVEARTGGLGGIQRNCLGNRVQCGKLKLIESNLVRNIKGNKKSFYRNISIKRQTREIVDPLQKEIGDLVTWGMKKVEVSNASFASFLTKKVLQPRCPNGRKQRQEPGE